MPCIHMDLRHPIDQEFRERLKKLGPNQAALAAAIGRSQSWLNKYMHGAGNATIDDLIRITATIIGVEAQPLTEMERRVLKAWRQVHEDRQEDAVMVLENVAKGYRRPLSQESNAPKVRTARQVKSTARGTQ